MIKLICDADGCEEEAFPQYVTYFVDTNDKLIRLVGLIPEWYNCIQASTKYSTIFYDTCSTECVARVELKHKKEFNNEFFEQTHVKIKCPSCNGNKK